MLSESLVWLILFAPLAAFVIIGFVIRPLMRLVIPVAAQEHGDDSTHSAHGRSICRNLVLVSLVAAMCGRLHA